MANDDEILVRIHATTVNRSDCGWRAPHPFFSRVFTGLLRPKRPILGSELAGVVEAVGLTVTAFEVGDEVFGIKSGAHAEYVCAREGGAIAQKPSGMSFEEAAAVCDGAIIALTCLRKAGLQRGRASSSTAHPARSAPPASSWRSTRCALTAVCDTKNVELVRSLGADEVIDYDPGGLHEERRGVRRCLRRRRQALVPTLPGLSEARRRLRRDRLGFMWHAPALVL